MRPWAPSKRFSVGKDSIPTVGAAHAAVTFQQVAFRKVLHRYLLSTKLLQAVSTGTTYFLLDCLTHRTFPRTQSLLTVIPNLSVQDGSVFDYPVDWSRLISHNTAAFDAQLLCHAQAHQKPHVSH